jgi:hypothetical protein
MVARNYKHVYILEGGHGYNLPPVFTTFDPRWKIRTIPKPMGKGMLDTLEMKVAQTFDSKSSSSESIC